MKKSVLIALFAFVLTYSFSSCRDTKKADDMEDVVDDVEDTMDDAVEQAADAVDDDATDPVENTIQEGVNEVKENTGTGGVDDAR